MRFATIVLIFSLFITGCATSPPLPKIESSRGDRIGVLVEAGDNPTHTHIGTTVFNNFEKKYPYNLHLSSEVAHTVEQAVRNAGFTAVDLRAEGINFADVSGLIQANGEKWQITSGKEETMRRLREQHRLKAVFVLKENRVLTALECSGGPCSERYADSSGLYTRSFFGLTSYYAVAAYQWNVLFLDPVADAAMADPLRAMLRMPSTPLSGFKTPANFENLTEAEFAPVRDAILRFTESTSKEAVKALNVK